MNNMTSQKNKELIESIEEIENACKKLKKIILQNDKNPQEKLNKIFESVVLEARKLEQNFIL